MSDSRQTEDQEAAIRQQVQGVRGRRIAWVLAVAVTAGLAAVALSAAFLSLDRPQSGVHQALAPPEQGSKLEYSRLGAEGRGQRLARENLRARDGYGWVDRESRVARIPVRQAMEWLLMDPRLLETIPEEEP